jgi:hypothetical protein
MVKLIEFILWLSAFIFSGYMFVGCLTGSI